MADAMRAVLEPSSMSPKATYTLEMRASYDAINARLDHDLVAKGHSLANLPALLRHFQGHNNIGAFAAMIDFACTPRQRLVNWRNCTAHKDMLATMNLSDPDAVFKKMEAEARGKLSEGGYNNSTMAGNAVPSGSWPQQPRQTPVSNLVHPHFPHDKPPTPQTPINLLSPYSTPVQQPANISNGPSSSPTIPCLRIGSPYAENAAVKPVAKPPTPSLSPFRPLSAQEHLQESRTHVMEGHMPHLSTSTYRDPSIGDTHSSPSVNHTMAANAPNDYGQAPPPENANVHSNPYSAPVAVTPNRGVTQQQQQQQQQQQHYQAPYAHVESFYETGNDQFTASQSGHPMRQNNHATFDNDSNSRPTHQPGTQAQPQQRNGYTTIGNVPNSHPAYWSSVQLQPQQQSAKPVMRPYDEFQAAINRQPPLDIHMRETVNHQEPVRHMPETTTSQQHERVYIEGPHSAQPGQHGLLVPPGYQHAAPNKRRHQSELSDSAAVQKTTEHPSRKKQKTAAPIRASNSYAEAAAPTPQIRRKTKEQLEYERQLAEWEKCKAEKVRQERIEEERKQRIKAELSEELRQGNDVLNYRYRDYLEVNPLPKGERMNSYYLSFLANSAVDENDRTEGAMAVRYAKEKYWNQWKISDKSTVIELLREKAQKQDHGMLAEMKTGGYLITLSDIRAIRKTAPLYAAPKVPLLEVEIED